MMCLKYKKAIANDEQNVYVELPIFNNYSLTKSSQDISYSDFCCDYTGYTKEDLPEKYQEVQIIDENNIIGFGYIDNYKFDELREVDIETTINIGLLTPKKLATLKTVIAVGKYEISDLLNIILEPLINEGFEIAEMDITTSQATVNFLAETVEYCMNNLSNKYNFWWHIDENKKIHIRSIESMFNEEPRFIYDNDNRIKGLEYLKPSTESDDYANVIVFKNVRVYETSFYSENNLAKTINPLLNEYNKTIKNGEIINFNYPIDVKNVKRAIGEDTIIPEGFDILYVFSFEFTYNDNTTSSASITYTDTNGIVYNNIGIEDDTKEISLQKDTFFDSLVTGFKFNNENKTIKKITTIISNNILVYNVNKVYNDKGIQSKKGIINQTGIVERIVDMNESWKTKKELVEIASSYINKNSFNYANEIEVKIDNDALKVGDIVKINKLMVDGVYVVTKIIQNFDRDTEYYVTLKNANMLKNFVDIFRSEPEQIDDMKLYNISVSHYIEEEIQEVHEVVK